MPAKLKKDRVAIPVGKYRARRRRNYRLFREDYDNWKQITGSLKGRTIGQKRVKHSLWKNLQQQGLIGRVMGNSGPASNEGGNKIFIEIDKIFRTKDYSTEQMTFLEELEKMMDKYSTETGRGNGNPANIMFTDKWAWTGKGKIRRERPVYGHYLTEFYVEYRNEFKNENLKPVDASWYSYNEGEAKPPMWQALYGEGTVMGKNSKSLHIIIKEAIKNFDELDLRFDKSTPIPIEGQGSADLALEIGEIKMLFTAMVRDPEFTTAQGNFATTRARTRIKNAEIDLESRREVNAIKRIERELGEIPNDIETIFITMSRRQMLHMAKKVGWEKYRDKFMKERGKKE